MSFRSRVAPATFLAIARRLRAAILILVDSFDVELPLAASTTSCPSSVPGLELSLNNRTRDT